MKKIYVLIFTVLCTSTILPTFVNATSDTKVSEVLGTTADQNVQNLNEQEVARTEAITNQLSLELPTQTDNPSYALTFKDPSVEKVGVQLEIDGKGYSEIKSPSTLPALGIGDHTLKFKFTDAAGTTQILEKQMIILPRAPIINVPIISDTKIAISGTGLAKAEILLLISSGEKILSATSNIDENGKWIVDVDSKELGVGVFSINGYTRKYGYASNLSDVLRFEIGNSNGYQIKVKEEGFSIKNITKESILNFLNTNKLEVIISASTFVLGIIIGILIMYLTRKKNEDAHVKKISQDMNRNSTKSSELTLRERLQQNAEAEIKKTEETEVKVEKVEDTNKEKIVTKIDFLKEFKSFDPDNKDGKEEEKPKIKITLTSQKD